MIFVYVYMHTGLHTYCYMHVYVLPYIHTLIVSEEVISPCMPRCHFTINGSSALAFNRSTMSCLPRLQKTHLGSLRLFQVLRFCFQQSDMAPYTCQTMVLCRTYSSRRINLRGKRHLFKT